MRVDDQPGHLVGFVWNDGLGEERRKRQIGQCHLCGDTFRGAPRSEPGECITRTERRCARQQRLQIIERMARTGERV